MSTACGNCERPVGDGLRLCETCGVGLVDALRAVPGLLDDLETARAGQARISTERAGGRSAEAPLPIKDTTNEKRGVGVHMLGHREQLGLATALHGWARILAEHLGVEIPIGSTSLATLALNARHTGGSVEVATIARFSRLRLGVWVDEYRVAKRTAAQLVGPVGEAEQLAVWLGCYPHELRTLDAATEAHRDLVDGVDRLRRVVDRPADRKYLGRCPAISPEGVKCDANLWAAIGETWVRCRGCRQQHAVEALTDDAADAAREMLCTMPELLRACAAIGRPIGRSTGYRWAHEGRLTARGWLTRTEHGDRITDYRSDDATPVYRVGDALHLASGGAEQTADV